MSARLRVSQKVSRVKPESPLQAEHCLDLREASALDVGDPRPADAGRFSQLLLAEAEDLSASLDPFSQVHSHHLSFAKVLWQVYAQGLWLSRNLCKDKMVA